MGIALACVGVFHVNDFFVLRNAAATGMVIAFAVLMIGLPRFLPQLLKIFLVLGHVFLAVLVFTAVLFATGYYNLTAAELVAAVLIFSWIIVFLRTVSAVSSDGMRADPAARHTVVDAEGAAAAGPDVHQ